MRQTRATSAVSKGWAFALWLAAMALISIANPQVAAAGLLAGALACMVITRAWFHPSLLLAASLSAYLLFGGLNISTYRGLIDPGAFRAIFANICLLTAGAGIGTALYARSAAPWSMPNISRSGVWVSAAPGILGVLWIVATVGLPVLNPNLRFFAPTKAVILAELLTVSIALQVCRLIAVEQPHWSEKLALAALFALLAVAGYRGWLLVAAAVGLTAAVLSGRMRLSPARALAYPAIAAVFLASGAAFRRLTNPLLLSVDAAKAKFRITDLPFGLEQLHLNVREPIALTQRLITRYEPGSFGHNLFFSDLKTILPGADLTGGKIIGMKFGKVLEGGLSPGLTGVLYADYGSMAAVFALAIGLISGLAWSLAHKHRKLELLILYGFSVVYTMHLFHRGIPKVTYFVIPAMFAACAFLMSPRKRNHITPAAVSAR